MAQSSAFLFPAHPITTSVNGQAFGIGKIGESLYLLIDLNGQFTGGHQYQGMDAVVGFFSNLM